MIWNMRLNKVSDDFSVTVLDDKIMVNKYRWYKFQVYQEEFFR